MANTPSPTIRRRQLGKALRRERENRKITLKGAADWLDTTTSNLSKIELGKQAIKPSHVRLLMQLFDIGAPEADTYIRLARESNERGWWASYSDTIPEWFETFLGLEADAEELRTYTPELIDGLLQTPRYAQAIVRTYWPQISDDELQRSADLRQARQQQLRTPNPPVLKVVLNEAVLRRQVGEAEVWKEQLEYLVAAGERDNVTLRLLPFSAGPHPGMTAPFTLFKFPEGYDMDAVYIENERGALWLERPADRARYIDVFDRICSLALSPEETSQLIANLAHDL
ncbi:helix-turn-helix transcriptional regulator [Saccharopolyspora sp. ASAGF58]|uniref:helix-turn-helix domain-containing protein n=1 Tax=Saccharopolyspora sp. ASAGF58 TaxID=2719023 RepID=UPI00143FC442|nr:helix-turn-helix transcriptional regulator [Saccharopolyspora sp. ASAGF58]QIZ35935.1 helix-turn-helix domain-containing protein [Saccharopolyspora sp. ASAGF58]